jgi:hypothetical protein
VGKARTKQRDIPVATADVGDEYSELVAALGRVMSEDEVLEVLEEAEASDDTLEYLRDRLHNASALPIDVDGILAEQQLTVIEKTVRIRNARTRQVVEQPCGWILEWQPEDTRPQYMGVTGAWGTYGRAIAFDSYETAEQAAIREAGKMALMASSRRFKFSTVTLSVMLDPTPDVTSPRQFVGLHLDDVEATTIHRILRALKQENVEIRGRRCETPAAAIRYLLKQVLASSLS